MKTIVFGFSVVISDVHCALLFLCGSSVQNP